MSYIFGDLKTKLATQIGDPNLDTTVTGDALNYTEQEIFNNFELVLNSSYQTNTVAASANTLTTTLPTDLQKITSLYITSPSGREADLTDMFMTPKDFRKAFPSVTIASPLNYWTFFTQIEFSTLADVAHTLRIEYIKSVTLMTAASDIPTIPQTFEELLMLGAKIRVYEQKEDFDYAGQFQTRYADLLESFVSRYSTRQVDAQFIIPGPRQTYSRTR